MNRLTDIKVYKVLEDELSIDVVKAKQDIKAKLATDEEAKLLNVLPGSALLTTIRLTLTAQDRVVEYLQSRTADVWPGHGTSDIGLKTVIPDHSRSSYRQLLL